MAGGQAKGGGRLIEGVVDGVVGGVAVGDGLAEGVKDEVSEGVAVGEGVRGVDGVPASRNSVPIVNAANVPEISTSTATMSEKSQSSLDKSARRTSKISKN